MSLASLQNYPRTRDEFALWSFGHAAHHRDILRRIFETKNQNLTSFLLDPFDPTEMGSWTQNHWIMHQQMDKALNIQSYDLSQLDWEDPELMTDWLQKNYYEHSIAAQLLNIG